MAAESTPHSFDHELVTLPSGRTLEMSWTVPSGHAYSQNDPARLAVCLHPWSWLGGNMDDPVLALLEEPLVSKRYHVVRYNSRGVGRSRGRSSFTGASEAEDLEEVVGWAMRVLSHVDSVVVVGYSHGSLIASRLPILPPPTRTHHVLLSYPLGPRSWLTLFRGKEYDAALARLLRSPGAHVLVAYGDQDEFTSDASYEGWVKELRKVAGEGEHVLKVVRIQGATHFWRGERGRDIGTALQGWIP